MFSNKIKPILSFRFYCNICDYGTSKKSNIENHNKSIKHISNEINPKLSSSPITCENCYKEYKDCSGLWRHKKKCIVIKKEEEDLEELTISPELILNIIQQNAEFKDMLLEQNKQNQELQKQVIEICKSGTTNNSTNNSTLQIRQLKLD